MTERELEPFGKKVVMPEKVIDLKILRDSVIGIRNQIIKETSPKRRGKLEKVIKDLKTIIRRAEWKRIKKAKAIT
jgi:hypothetical protein